MVKNLPANARDIRDAGSIPGSGRSPGGGNGNPLKYSCLKNPMNRGAWWATVHRVKKSQTQLKQLSRHACRVLADNCHWLNLRMTVFWKQGTNQSTFCNSEHGSVTFILKKTHYMEEGMRGTKRKLAIIWACRR